MSIPLPNEFRARNAWLMYTAINVQCAINNLGEVVVSAKVAAKPTGWILMTIVIFAAYFVKRKKIYTAELPLATPAPSCYDTPNSMCGGERLE